MNPISRFALRLMTSRALPCLFCLVLCALSLAPSPALASLESYDAMITADAAGGLRPTARLTSALTFTGSNPVAFNFGAVSGDATIEFVLQGDPGANNSAYLAVGANANSNLRFEVWQDTGELGFTQLGVADYAFTPGVPSPTQPSHVAYAWSATTRTMKLYLNGRLAGTCTGVSPDFGMPDGNGWLGANPAGGEPMVGTVYRLTSYSGTLAEEVIQAHANAYNDIVTPPSVLAFTAAPALLFTPASSVLTWEVRNATALFLNGANVTGQSNLTVSPLLTTDYTLLATNSGGTAQATVRIVVNPAPSIYRFFADTAYTPANQIVPLRWETSYAQKLWIEPELGDVTANTINGAGTVGVLPTTTTYNLFAANAFGTNSATVEIHVVHPANHLVINEFMAEDQDTLPDEDGDSTGWIELFNPGPAPVNLAGYCLSDDPDAPCRWAFPATNLAARGFLVVHASGKDRATAGGRLHTNFQLKNAGKYLGLVGPGMALVHAYQPGYPPQRPGVSYGLLAADTGLVRYLVPTPGSQNSESQVPLAPIDFSVAAGVFTNAFELRLTTLQPGAEIRFTLNGSEPSATNGAVYRQPITIGGTTRVRAVAVSGGRSGPVSGATYLRLAPDLAGYTSTLPVLLIENFGAGTIPRKGWNGTGGGLKQVPRQTAAWATFDQTNGITSLSGEPQMLSLIGIRGRGAYSSEWRQKPYSVEAMDEEGAEVKVSPFGMPNHADWVLYFPDPDQSRDPTLLFNTFAYELSHNLGHYSARFRWVEVFLNEDGGDLSLADRRGVYAVMERVARGDDRLDFQQLSLDGSTGGWLLNINRMDPEPEYGWPAPNGATQPWFFHTAGRDRIPQTEPNTAYGAVPGDDLPQQQNAFINFDNPNGYVIRPQQRAAIENWFKQFEDVLFDNTRWRDPLTGYRNYLDAVDFADYFIINVLTRNGDGLLLSMYPWKGDDGKLRMGPAWDYNWSAYYISGGPTGSLMHRSEQLWYARLFEDPDFQQLYIDRWWTARRGPLSNAAMEAIIDRQSAEISSAKALLNGLPSANEWASRLAQMKAWLKDRADWIDTNYLRPPAFNQNGGNVADGFLLTVTGANGTIYLTVDGTDPRAPGGAIAPGARAYTGPLPLYSPTPVNARVKNGAAWSGLTFAMFSTPQDLTRLAVTEIMYNPAPTGIWTSDQLEFLELKNTGVSTLNLSLLQFTDGIEFTFTNQTLLEPGRLLLLVRDATAFQALNPGVPIGGIYSGRLNNGGETLRLALPSGETVFDLTYNNRAPWPLAPDGHGFSAVPSDPNAATINSNQGSQWRASANPGGSPGADDPEPNRLPVLINEVLAQSTPPELDSIELLNPNSVAVDIGGWFLSDDGGIPTKFRIASPTVLPPGGYRVFTETDFNASPGAPASFSLDSAGDSLYLSAADAAGQFTGFTHGLRFGGSASNVTFGRFVNSVGEEQFPAQQTATLGRPNSDPSVGPIIITEIHYHPPTNSAPFVEIQNITSQPVALFDPANPASTWILSGFGFSFPPEFTLPAGGIAVITATNAADFRRMYTVPDGTPILGPATGNLQRNGELLELARPETRGTNAPVWITIDAVRYDNKTPWPPEADGGEASLQRLVPNAHGNDPINWFAAAVTPGTARVPGDLPVITQPPVGQSLISGSSVTLSVAVTNTAALPITYNWRRNGEPIPGGTVILDSHICFFTITNAQPAYTFYSVDISNPAVPEGFINATVIFNFLADADQDQMPDDWETVFGLNPAEPSDGQGDSDEDGLLNWQEYAAGTYPGDAASSLRIDAVPLAGTSPGVGLRFQARAGKTYTLEYADTLDSSAWIHLADFPAESSDRAHEVPDTSSRPNRYYRVVTPARP